MTVIDVRSQRSKVKVTAWFKYVMAKRRRPRRPRLYRRNLFSASASGHGLGLEPRGRDQGQRFDLEVKSSRDERLILEAVIFAQTSVTRPMPKFWTLPWPRPDAEILVSKPDEVKTLASKLCLKAETSRSRPKPVLRS